MTVARNPRTRRYVFDKFVSALVPGIRVESTRKDFEEVYTLVYHVYTSDVVMRVTYIDRPAKTGHASLSGSLRIQAFKPHKYAQAISDVTRDLKRSPNVTAWIKTLFRYTAETALGMHVPPIYPMLVEQTKSAP